MGDGGVKKSLLKLARVRTQVVAIEGDDGSPAVEVLVREVSATEFAQYGEMLTEAKAKKLAREPPTAYLISVCIVEQSEDGLTPVYTADEAIDIARSARVSMPIVNAIMALSGFGEKPPGEPDAS